MPTGIKEGIGATLGFGTSSVTINLVDINLDGVSVDDIPTNVWHAGCQCLIKEYGK